MKSKQQVQGNKELFVSSTIIPKEQQTTFGEQLNEWSGCQRDQKWKLLYKGSRDGFKADDFHRYH